MNDLGPGLVMLDDATGDIRYSMCNSNSTPVFPYDDDAFTLDLAQYPPRKDTGLAGAGWYDPASKTAHVSGYSLGDRAGRES